MNRGLRILAAATTGLFAGAVAALPQIYTISARPGEVNYIEGVAYLNGNKLSEQAVRATFLSAGDSLSTAAGKVEVLLTPGVFLRIGENSEMHMISPSLTGTQVEIVQGEGMLEAAGLLKDSQLQVTDQGATISIERNGLYRFKADDPASVAVLEGKAIISLGGRNLELSKGHETVLGPVLKAEKFDPKQDDELYAWSNVRSEYEAAASYQAAKAVSVDSYTGGWGNYRYAGIYGPGWFWNSAFDCWAWLPAYGAFYSPFGWGFYAPGVIGYAPVVNTVVYRGGGWTGTGNPNWKGRHWNGTSTTASVAIRPDRPPAVGVIASSPWAENAARAQAARSIATTGTFNPSASGSSGFVTSSHVTTSGPVTVHGVASGGGNASGGGWVGGPAHAGGFAGGSAGGHAAAGGGGGGHH